MLVPTVIAGSRLASSISARSAIRQGRSTTRPSASGGSGRRSGVTRPSLLWVIIGMERQAYRQARRPHARAVGGRRGGPAYCQATGWRGAIWQRSRLVIGRLGVRVPPPAPAQSTFHLPSVNDSVNDSADSDVDRPGGKRGA